MTVALVDAVYSLATPGVNGPKPAGAPIVRASVAGTLPPTVPGVSVFPSTWDLTADTLPLKSFAIQASLVPGARSGGSGSARARGGLYSVEAVVGIEPS